MLSLQVCFRPSFLCLSVGSSTPSSGSSSQFHVDKDGALGGQNMKDVCFHPISRSDGTILSSRRQISTFGAFQNKAAGFTLTHGRFLLTKRSREHKSGRARRLLEIIA